MIYRILGICALILFLVLAANGYLQRWLGLETLNGTTAGVISTGGSDLRAVEGWATANYGSELCGFTATDEAEAQKRSDWDEDPEARRTIAEVQKKIRETEKDEFCQQAWSDFGPSGKKVSDLLEK